jgi:hypothetical protein
MFGKYRRAVPVSNLLPIVVISCLSSLLNDRNRIPISYFIISISLTLSKGSFSKFSRGTLTGAKLPGGGGGSHQSLSRRVYPHYFVREILKIFKCLGLKSNSCGKIFDKFTKIYMTYKKRYYNVWNPVLVCFTAGRSV